MTDYRVIIAGSRSFNDYVLLREQCLSILQEKMRTHRVIIVSGHARGADSLGERFAKEFRLPFELHPAKWRLLGRAAGMVRNAEMAKCSDALIAFWNGESSGTRHMINFARKRGLEISVIDLNQPRSQITDRMKEMNILVNQYPIIISTKDKPSNVNVI